MRYILDDLDINNFVHAWLRHLATGNPEAVTLLLAATDDPFSGGCFLLRNVGPQKRTSFAATEQLILYAVLTVYQDPALPWTRQAWQGTNHHVQHAFTHANTLGRSGVAAALLTRVTERDTTRTAADNSSPTTGRGDNERPQRATSNQETVQAFNRDIEAAILLAPTLRLDGILADNDGRATEAT